MQCTICGSSKQKAAKEAHRYVVGKILFKGDIPVMRCAECGETFADASVLREFDRKVAGYLAEHGPATGETFRFMRKAIGLPAREVAKILSARPETVSRWETGAVDVDRLAWTTLGSIVLDDLAGTDTTRSRLAALDSKRRAKQVPVRVTP